MKNRALSAFTLSGVALVATVLACLAVLLFAKSASASANIIAFDTQASTFATNPSLSFTRGTSASQYIGLVFLGNGGANTQSSCSWGGSPMTLIVDFNDPSASHNAWYYIVNPPSGSQTVSCSTSGNFQMAVMTYSGVDQISPLDTIKYGQLYATSTSASVSSGGSLTISGTTTVDNTWTVLGANFGASIAAGAGSTERVTDTTYDSNGPISPAGGHTMAVVNDSGGPSNLVGIMIALKPATIAFDTASATFATNPSLSFTRGTSAANYIGLVFLGNGGANTQSSCSWGGTGMTQIVDFDDPYTSHNAWYYIVAPPSGAQTVSCTTSGNFNMVAETYSGVNQSSPLDTIKYGQLYATSTSNTVAPSGSLTVTATTQADNDWMVLGANFGAGLDPGTGSTERSPDTTYDSNGPISPAGAAAMSLVNPTGVTSNILEIMIALKRATN